jgi:hypothetical protein
VALVGTAGLGAATTSTTGSVYPPEEPLETIELEFGQPGRTYNPLDDFVVFRNDGEETLDLTGWVVRDRNRFRETDREYQFPDGFTLAPGNTVTLFSGQGTDTSSELYWGRTRTVWASNGNGTVIILDETGQRADRLLYDGRGPIGG